MPDEGSSPSPRFSIREYSIPNLRIEFFDLRPPQEPEHYKYHFDYFESYFLKLQARTIVTELEYIDEDYLTDYGAVYSRCFRKAAYGKSCRRLHFFTRRLDADQLLDYLSAYHQHPQVPHPLQADYLGYIVIKPLPHAVIGRACLKCYDRQCSEPIRRRIYPCTRKYKANLFGLDLEVRTLAFQEQDRVIAACATSALWTAFNKTGQLFHHRIPRPVEITQGTGMELLDAARTIPSKGLTMPQMGHAVRRVGLDPEFMEPSSTKVLASVCYAYNRAGIPVLAMLPICKLLDQSPGCMAALMPGPTERWGITDWHAVVVAGYSVRKGQSGIDPSTGAVVFTNYGIEKLYVHDDQIGPFSRVVPDGKKIVITENIGAPCNFALQSLACSWTNKSNNLGTGRFGLGALIAPVDVLIQINYFDVITLITSIDKLLEGMHREAGGDYEDRIVWDVFLDHSNQLKKDLRCCPHVRNSERRRILLEHMPKYVWRALGRRRGSPVLELVLDATDNHMANYLVTGVRYNGEYCERVRSFLYGKQVERSYVLPLEVLRRSVGEGDSDSDRVT